MRSFPTALFTVIAGAAFAHAQIPSTLNVSAPDLPAAIRQQQIVLQQPAAKADAFTWWKLARLQQDAARYPDAERSYAHAISLLQTGDRATLAGVMDGLGTLYVETGALDRAQPLEIQALAIRQALGDHTGEGRSWMHLAMLSLGKHDISGAAHYAQLAAQRLLDPVVPLSDAPAPEEQMTALIDLALVRCAQNLCSAAIPLLKHAHRLALASGPAHSFPDAFTDFLLGYANWHNGDLHAAAKLMHRGVAGLETQLDPRHPTYIAAMTQYAAFLDRTRHPAQAAAIRARLAQIQTSPAPLETAALHP